MTDSLCRKRKLADSFIPCVNRLGNINLPRDSVDRLNDRPDMTIAVHRGHKTTTTNQK